MTPSRYRLFRIGFYKQVNGDASQQANDQVTEVGWCWIPAALLATAVVSCAPKVAVIAPPTAAIELVAPASITPPGERVNLDSVAPPGRARDLIVENCGTCHSFVCAFRGQRTVEHWQTIKQDMRDKVSQVSDQDYDALFAYLEANFNDQKPEPNLPPALQQLGCSSGVR